jgi:uncharacterized protein YdeI (YjbR/CyaY-like superfamily)
LLAPSRGVFGLPAVASYSGQKLAVIGRILENMTDELETSRFDSADAFRTWLRQHQDSSPGVWLTLAKKGSRTTTLTYFDALGVALEYGWIDGLAHRFDDDAYVQRFTPRRPRSPWSGRNRRRVEAMIEAGKMAPRGLAEVERARANGRWEAAYAGTTQSSGTQRA